MSTDFDWMGEAIREARLAEREDEVPIGAVLVRDGEIIGRGHNRKETLGDPTAHAEMEAIRAAVGQFPSWRLENCTLYVTLEPCPMCAGAILQARIGRVVYGCADPKAGAVSTLFRLLDDARLNHRCEVAAGEREEECRALLSEFFQKKRQEGKK